VKFSFVQLNWESELELNNELFLTISIFGLLSGLFPLKSIPFFLNSLKIMFSKLYEFPGKFLKLFWEIKIDFVINSFYY